MKKKIIALLFILIFISTALPSKAIFSYTNEKNDIKKEIKPSNNRVKSMNKLSQTEAIVYDGTQLKQILEDGTNGISTVYFGADITQVNGGISVNPNKLDLVISGTDPTTNIRYKYNEYSSAAYYNAISIGSSAFSGGNITLKDVDVVGQNYYGVINVLDTAKSVSITYDNINYMGPQLIWNRNGTSIIKDSNIVIPKSGMASVANEVGETYQLVFKGNNSIEHNTPGYAAFNFVLANGSITFEEDSTLKLESSTILNNGSTSDFNIIMEKNSKFIVDSSLSTGKFISGSTGVFEMKDNAIFNINANGNASIIDWENKKSDFKISNSHIKYTSKSNVTSKPFNLGKMNLIGSEITINNSYTNNTHYIFSNVSQSLIESNITINQIGNATNMNSGISTTGVMQLNKSTLNINATGIIGAKILVAQTLNMNDSKLEIKLSNNIYSSTSSNMINISADLVLLNSDINFDAQVESSNILYTKNLDISENSNIDLHTMQLNKYDSKVVEVSSNIIIPKNASMKINVGAINNKAAVLLTTNGGLSVASGTLQVISQSGDHARLIYLGGTGSKVIFTQPKSIVLYGSSVTSSLLASKYEITFYIYTQQVNTWLNSTGLDQYYLLFNLPRYQFKKETGNLTINGTIKSDNSKVNYTDIDSEPDPLSDFNFTTNQNAVIGIGQTSIDSDSIREGKTNISGNTGALADIEIKYQSNKKEHVSYTKSDKKGMFNLKTLPLDLKPIEIKGVHDFIYAHEVATIMPKGELKIINYPIELNFGSNTIPTKKIQLHNNVDLSFDIKDDREKASNWRLYAIIKTHLNDKKNIAPDIKNAFYYLDNNNNKHYLSDSVPTLVAESINGSTDTKLTWKKEKGINLELNPGNIFSNTIYSGEIQWILQPIE